MSRFEASAVHPVWWVAPHPPHPFDTRSLRWECASCGARVHDTGPYAAHPDDNETGHAPGCHRYAADIAACTDARRAPRLVVRVTVQAAYLHCAKAFMRSRLWDPATRVDRSLLPTIGQMIADQTGLQVPAETQEQMARRYAPDL